MRLAKLEYKWLVGIVFTMAMFLDLLDMSVTNVAIPTLAREFPASTTTIEWVITGYLLSLAMFIPVSGWLGDRFGTKMTFLSALSIFVAGSMLAGLAWSVESLVDPPPETWLAGIPWSGGAWERSRRPWR